MDQMRRAAVSIPSNIAEGVGKRSDRSLAYFLRIASGSIAELQTQLILFHAIYELPENEFTALKSRLYRLDMRVLALQSKLSS